MLLRTYDKQNYLTLMINYGMDFTLEFEWINGNLSIASNNYTKELPTSLDFNQNQSYSNVTVD